MATSLNGWAVIGPAPTSALATGVIPGTTRHVTMRREVLPLFLSALADVHRKVINLDAGKALIAGWSYRAARLGGGWSDHASATACDFRWDVLLADHKQHMTAAQHTAMHLILDKYRTTDGRRVLGWGGDWKVGTAVDEMHLEIGQSWQPGTGGKPTTVTDVRNVIARLRINANGISPAPVAKPVIVPFLPLYPGKPIALGATGPAIVELQMHLGLKPYTGVYDAATRAAVADYQRRHPALGTADGIVGPATYLAITGHR